MRLTLTNADDTVVDTYDQLEDCDYNKAFPGIDLMHWLCRSLRCPAADPNRTRGDHEEAQPNAR